MSKIEVWGFKSVPPFAQGLVRDLRARWALREAGIPYETRLLGIEERLSKAHIDKHPFGMVPVVEEDGAPLMESGAIVYSIARQSSALMPADEPGRDRVLAWMFSALNTVDPAVQEIFAIDLLHAGESWTQIRRPAAVAFLTTRLTQLEEALGERDYLLGRFTAADILMVTVLRFLRHTDILSGFPRLAAYVERAEQRPGFRDALAEQTAEYQSATPQG